MDMDLFDSLASKEGQYLSYIIEQYTKIISVPYNKIFVGREANLEVLLDSRFDEIKKGVDEQISKIKEGINSVNILILNAEDLEKIAKEMEDLANYLDYLLERTGKKDPKIKGDIEYGLDIN